jgi:predicted O-methyltransferase YrrM
MSTFPSITDPAIQAYCNQYSKSLSSEFAQLETATASTGQLKMISGPFLGQFLRMFALVLQPKRILEIGTFVGYGTRCLMEGLRESGKIYTLEKSDDYDTYARQAFASSARPQSIIQLKGDAAELIPTIDEIWDLVFIDAAKRQYSTYFDLVLPRLRKGGVILADNVLWKGKVTSPDNDKLGQGLDLFNQKVYADDRVDNVLLPIDDGINFIIKR